MRTSPTDVTTALATLRERWGAAAPQTLGALATAPLPSEPDAPPPAPVVPDAAPLIPVIGTGFAALDAILGPGGVPRTASVSLRGGPSSGRTTLALRLVAEAQAVGSIAAWLDLDRSFDAVEAVARGVRLEWLVVLVPVDLDEGLSLAGALLQARTVDLLLIDLPARLGRTGRVLDRLARLTALARRAGILLVTLETGRPDASDPLGAQAGLRLELARRSWIRLGRDVVGQRTEVAVARNRFGPPGGRAELRILYAEGGPRDTCLRDGALLADGPPTGEPLAPPGRPRPIPIPSRLIDRHATSPSPLAPSSAPARPGSPDGRRLRVVPGGTRDPGRPAVDGRDGRRRGSRRPLARGPAGDGSRDRPSARPGGGVPRPGAGG